LTLPPLVLRPGSDLVHSFNPKRAD
jgi:hypothetical protein